MLSTIEVIETLGKSPTVVVEGGNTVVVHEVVQPPAEVIELGLTGPQGPQGIQGIKGDKGDTSGYTHTQSSAASTWTIAHNLGFRPSVGTFTVGGVEMVGSVTHLSDNVLQIDFSIAVSGIARLN